MTLARTSKKKIVVASPIAITCLLMAWTAAVYRYSDSGTWHIYPALAVLPLVLVWHLALIVRYAPRAPMVVYAVLHLCVLAILWPGCLMLISKDSF